MKKADVTSFLFVLFLVPGLVLFNFSVVAQETSKLSDPLPDNINKIVTTSCMPCHTNKGGFMARGKLNFSEWTQYSPDKQIEKAEKMYSEIKKGAMPPKSARETRPEIVPGKEQVDIIKKWAESFKSK
jgi:hypothetical protein